MATHNKSDNGETAQLLKVIIQTVGEEQAHQEHRDTRGEKEWAATNTLMYKLWADYVQLTSTSTMAGKVIRTLTTVINTLTAPAPAFG